MGDMSDLYEERQWAEIAAGKPRKPGLINPLVCYQSASWWNVSGEEVCIAEMPPDYALDILCHCYQHPLLRDYFTGSHLQNALYNRITSAWRPVEAVVVPDEFIKGLFRRD